jgi:hypothetical protein
MAKSSINIGTIANDGTGDTLRAAGGKINDNFSEIYTALGDGTDLAVADVATTGSYTDLSDTPTIPADVSDLTDTTNLLFDGAYGSLTDAPTIPADISDLTDTTTLLFDGAYGSLTDAPSIPADISDLTDTTNLLFDGAYGSLTDAPSIPADTGDLTNTAGFVANSDATLTLAVSTTAPTGATGMFAVADGNTAGWDPKGTNLGVAYPVFYDGSSWTALL